MRKILAILLILHFAFPAQAFDTLEAIYGATYQKWDEESEPRIGAALRARKTWFSSSFGWVLKGDFDHRLPYMGVGYGYRRGGDNFIEFDLFASYVRSGLDPEVAIVLGRKLSSYTITFSSTYGVTSNSLQFVPYFGIIW